MAKTYEDLGREYGWLVPATQAHIDRAQAEIDRLYSGQSGWTARIGTETWVVSPFSRLPIPEEKQFAMYSVSRTPDA